jgi:predicted O-methyltransferase YrrM
MNVVQLAQQALGGSAAAPRSSEEIEFWSHMLAGEPYLGSYLGSGQVWTTRAPYMRQLAQRACAEGGRLQMLEIGSWAGASAILWATTAMNWFEAAGLPPDIRVLCVDAWRMYGSLATGEGDWYGKMRTAINDDLVFSLFVHNIETSGIGELVIPLRATSRTARPLLAEGSFDLVFIDGDHAYSSVVQDIRDYRSLVRDGGYLCGDDLDLQISEVDADYARAHAEVDYIQDPRTDGWYHPGVALAIGDECDADITAYAGFWVLQRRGDGWDLVDLHDEPVESDGS